MNNEASDNREHSFNEVSVKDELRILQLIRAGSVHFGILADQIATIVDWRAPTPLPHAPKSVLGVVSIQGRMLTVLELTRLTGGEAASSDNHRSIVALRGDEQLAIAVDSIGETIKIADRDLKPRQETVGAFILAILQFEGSEINILNLQELFPAALQGRERRRRRF
jgi:purine-binding chemotaxis protein CheW